MTHFINCFMCVLAVFGGMGVLAMVIMFIATKPAQSLVIAILFSFAALIAFIMSKVIKPEPEEEKKKIN